MSNNHVLPLRAHKLSLVTQAQQYLRALVEKGTYLPGQQLPSEKELAGQLGISRPTLREALLNLEQEGVVVRRHGVGTFVAPGYDNRLEGGLERLESVLELATRQHLEVQVENLDVQHVPANAELSGRLQVTPATSLTRVSRTIVVDGRAVAYMIDFAPATVLFLEDIGPAFNGSVLDLLRQKPGLEVGQAVANIVAVNSDRALAKELGGKTGQALLLLEETLFDVEGRALGFSRNFFVPDFFQFRVVRR
jgi:GntR family transcriptional regulator